MSVVLYATLAACTILTGLLVYRYDLYDREPLPPVLVAVGLGALSMWAMTPAEVWVVDTWLAISSNGGIAFVSASLEELAKFCVVLAIMRTFSRAFDDPMDGLIYGSMAGLGAAVEESVEILSDSGDLTVLPAAEIVRLFGHLVMGGMGGAGVGLLVVGHPRRRLVLGLGIGAAILLHFVWDYVALVSPVTTDDPTYAVVRCAIMGLGLGGFGWLVAQLSRLSRAHVDPGSISRLWGWPFVRR